jgi:3-dehydroquinate dehydratase/shikimate dehydrogenase
MTAGRATVVATLAAPPREGSSGRIAPGADWLELRADLAGEVQADCLRGAFPGRLLYTLRSAAHGGQGPDRAEERIGRLIAAATAFDAVDLEADRDLAPDLLAAIAPSRRIVSWHGPASSPAQLEDRLAAMSSVEAALYKLVPAGGAPGQDAAALQWVAAKKRDDIALFVGGEAGAWTRLVSARVGAPWVYVSAGVAAAPGQPPLLAWARDYGLPALPPVEALFGIVGRPVAHSLSPRLHNAAYRAQGLPYLYLAFAPETFADFWLDLAEGEALERLGMPLRGLSVTAPFKEAALAVAGAVSPLAERVGAVNTLIWKEGVWEGDTTDPEGVSGALRQGGIEIAGRRAAVLGAGASGRSAAAGLQIGGAEVTLFNRSAARGERAARRAVLLPPPAALAMAFRPLATFDPARFDIVVHATSLGRQSADPVPFALDRLTPAHAVVDLVYGEHETALAAAGRAAGSTVLDGRDVLWHQARGQYRRMTGRELPQDLARECLRIEAGGSA